MSKSVIGGLGKGSHSRMAGTMLGFRVLASLAAVPLCWMQSRFMQSNLQMLHQVGCSLGLPGAVPLMDSEEEK